MKNQQLSQPTIREVIAERVSRRGFLLGGTAGLGALENRELQACRQVEENDSAVLEFRSDDALRRQPETVAIERE